MLVPLSLILLHEQSVKTWRLDGGLAFVSPWFLLGWQAVAGCFLICFALLSTALSGHDN